MTDEFRIHRLIEEVLDSGRTAEEVCAECPELLPVVETRLRQIRRVEHELDALFPSSSRQTSGAMRPATYNNDQLAEIRNKRISSPPVDRLRGVAKWRRGRPVAVALVLLLVALCVMLFGAIFVWQ
jgi:serine/threonine-protein kinase